MASWDLFHPEAEPVATWLQRTRLQIVLFVVIVVAAAPRIAIIASDRLMPRWPIPLRKFEKDLPRDPNR